MTDSPRPLPLDDPERLAAMRRTALMDSPAEEAFDRLTRLASRLLGAPVALVSLVDPERQFFKSAVGLPEPWASERETPLSHSFCQHVVSSAEPLVVEDAREDPLLCDNLAIPDLDVIAYAGIPITTASGYVLGSFCAIDSQPRRWTEDELATLVDLAASVSSEIELRHLLRETERRALELNDDVMQCVASARLALEMGDAQGASASLASALASVRKVMSELAPGDAAAEALRRRRDAAP